MGGRIHTANVLVNTNILTSIRCGNILQEQVVKALIQSLLEQPSGALACTLKLHISLTFTQLHQHPVP